MYFWKLSKRLVVKSVHGQEQHYTYTNLRRGRIFLFQFNYYPFIWIYLSNHQNVLSKEKPQQIYHHYKWSNRILRLKIGPHYNSGRNSSSSRPLTRLVYWECLIIRTKYLEYIWWYPQWLYFFEKFQESHQEMKTC